jgi:hypothetical protein
MKPPFRRAKQTCVAALALSCGVATAQPAADLATRCGPARDPETLAFAQRVIDEDVLYRFLVSAHGLPARCRTQAVREKDQENVSIRFGWQGGMSLTLSYSSPEISITTVRDARGLERIPQLEAAFRTYVRDNGLAIDWDTPTVSRRGGTMEREYSDPDPGLNGIVRYVFDSKGRLVEMRQSIAP